MTNEEIHAKQIHQIEAAGFSIRFCTSFDDKGPFATVTLHQARVAVDSEQSPLDGKTFRAVSLPKAMQQAVAAIEGQNGRHAPTLRIESDGTAHGTKITDANGVTIPHVTEMQLAVTAGGETRAFLVFHGAEFNGTANHDLLHTVKELARLMPNEERHALALLWLEEFAS